MSYFQPDTLSPFLFPSSWAIHPPDPSA